MSTLALRPRHRTRRPPELPGGLPFVGHALEFHRNPVRFLRRARREMGEAFSFVMAGTRIALLTGPKANETFFRAPDNVLSARAAYQFMVPIFGKDVAYGASEEKMSEQLDLITPALTERRLRTYVGYINEEIESYLAGLGETGEFELTRFANELTTFIASRCLIGREFRQNLSTELAHLYHDLEGGINLLAFFWPHLPLPSFQRRDRARLRMVELIGAIIADRKARGVQEEDFLQTLMAARYRDGSTLPDAVITGMLLTLIFAGQHTSAVQAAWAGLELLRHPEYVVRVRREQADLMGRGRALDFDALREMVVLERAIQESERLHPPLIVLMRKIIGELKFKDYAMTPGWLAMVSPAISHRLPEVFADPDRYDPDRFGPGREEDKKARFSIITFGGGKHGCIGLTFAYLQVKAIWSTLLRRFDLELIDPDPRPNYATFVVGPKPPCRVRYRRK